MKPTVLITLLFAGMFSVSAKKSKTELFYCFKSMKVQYLQLFNQIN